MRRLLTSTEKELRVLRRDWQGLVVLFALPAVFILTMSLALQGSFQERLSREVVVPVTLASEGAASRLLLRTLDDGGSVRPRQVSMTPQGVREAVIRGELAYGVVVHPGLGRWIETGQSPEGNALVEIYVDPAVTAFRRTALEVAVGRALQTLRVERLIAGTPGIGMAASAGAQGAGRLPVAVRAPAGHGGQLPNAVQQNVPAWLVFAMFFVVIPISTVFIVERQQGSAQRLQLMNVPAGVVFGGKILPYYLVNMTQMLIMLAVGIWLVPLLGGDRLDPGGSFFGLWLIGSGTSVAAIGYALLISTVAGTTVQATTFAGIANLVMGAVGGVMVPKVVMAPDVQALTVLSPMSWGLEGFWDILLRDQGWTAVLPETAALAALGAICLTLGARIFTGKR